VTTREWFEANQRDMVAALERVRLALAYRAGAESAMPPVDGDKTRSTPFADGPALALGELQRVFGLSPFERDVVLLCAGVEMDGRFAPLIARRTATTRIDCRRSPSLSQCFARTLECVESGVTSARLANHRIERPRHHLGKSSGSTSGFSIFSPACPASTNVCTGWLRGLLRVRRTARARRSDSRTRGASRRGASSRPTAARELTVAEITGSDTEFRLAIAAAACAAIGAVGLLIRSADVPSQRQSGLRSRDSSRAKLC
jgi:hypothetical protein